MLKTVCDRNKFMKTKYIKPFRPVHEISKIAVLATLSEKPIHILEYAMLN